MRAVTRVVGGPRHVTAGLHDTASKCLCIKEETAIRERCFETTSMIVEYLNIFLNRNP